MKTNYNFSKAKRGAVTPASKTKIRITIRLDRDLVEWFKRKVVSQGGGNYQSMMNDALRMHMDHHDEAFEKLLRKVVREEIKKAS